MVEKERKWEEKTGDEKERNGRGKKKEERS